MATVKFDDNKQTCKHIYIKKINKNIEKPNLQNLPFVYYLKIKIKQKWHYMTDYPIKCKMLIIIYYNMLNDIFILCKRK